MHNLPYDHQRDDNKEIFKEIMSLINFTDFTEEKRKNVKRRPDFFHLQSISILSVQSEKFLLTISVP